MVFKHHLTTKIDKMTRITFKPNKYKYSINIHMIIILIHNNLEISSILFIILVKNNIKLIYISTWHSI